MSRLKLLLKLFIFLLVINVSFNALAEAPLIKQQDPLQQIRALLSQQLNPSHSSIERVFNPIDEGEALLVRTYRSGLQELVFRPLVNTDAQLDEQNSFVLRTLPNTDVSEVLISFDAANTEYKVYFGQFKYSVKPDLNHTEQLRVSPEALPFLTQHFQTLFIDQPAIALAAKYLHQQQYRLNQPAIIQLKKEYRDNVTGQVLVNGEGEILNRYRFSLYDIIPVQPVYFLEYRPFGSTETASYYIENRGLQSYQVGISGSPLKASWIPLEQVRSAIMDDPQPSDAPVENRKIPILN